MAEKPNQENQLDFFGSKRYQQRRLFIPFSIDSFSRWPAACIYEVPTRKSAKTFPKKTIYPIKRIPLNK